VRIVELKQGGTHAFTVYPASSKADELLKDLLRYAVANGLFVTVGSHELDPRRIMHLSDLTPAQAVHFRKQWAAFLAPATV
jgi:hypothetical protein